MFMFAAVRDSPRLRFGLGPSDIWRIYSVVTRSLCSTCADGRVGLIDCPAATSAASAQALGANRVFYSTAANVMDN